MLLGLLERDPKKRLGHSGMSEIKNHPFFSSIDWARLSNLGIKPPVRPVIDEDEDSDD